MNLIKIKAIRIALPLSSVTAISPPKSKNLRGLNCMASERTLSIIKPDATERNLTGLIIARLESAGLRVVAQKRVWWKKKDARKFYDVHKDQPFFKDLINFMTSGPIVLKVLEGEDAIAKNCAVMGATNPVDAGPDHSQRFRRQCAAQLGARLRQPRDGQARDRALLQQERDRGVRKPWPLASA